MLHCTLQTTSEKLMETDGNVPIVGGPSCSDYGNSLLVGLPTYLACNLQSVQNAV